MKTIWFLIALTLSLLAMTLAPTPAVAGSDGAAEQPIMLKPHAAIDGDIIYLGDLFDGLEAKADTVVAYAPAPGRRVILEANWLARLARAHRIKWKPVNSRTRMVVERNAIVIEREEIEDRIMTALGQSDAAGSLSYGPDSDMRLTLSNRMLRLYLPTNSSTRIGVENLNYNPVSGRFSAMISVPEGDPMATRHRVTGRMQKMVRVAVAADRLMPGEVIRANNIKTIWLPADKLQQDILTDPAQLIGKAPKRGLTPNRPIRSAEVRNPILVTRGGMVTIKLQMANMMLTSQGKALENGSEGDVIRIVNLQSNKTIQAAVTSAGIVTVRAPAHELAENTTSRTNPQW